MFALIAWASRRFLSAQSTKRRWLRRLLLAVAVVRWFDARSRRARVVRIGPHEHAEIVVVGDNGGTG